MPIFKIKEPNKEVKYIKNDKYKLTGVIEFTNIPSEAYRRNGEYYAKQELKSLKFHFEDVYPELQYATTEWTSNDTW